MRTVRLSDEAASTRLGAAVAPLLARGEAVLLEGALGMGKSTVARGLIRALAGPDEDVPSPTFTLVQVYETEPAVAHFDLYRLERPQEAREIGLDEALDLGAALIEWPVRLGDDLARVLGPDRLTIALSEAGAGRDATVSGVGTWANKVERLVEGWND